MLNSADIIKSFNILFFDGIFTSSSILFVLNFSEIKLKTINKSIYDAIIAAIP